MKREELQKQSETYVAHLDEAAAFIRRKISKTPEVILVSGSGLGSVGKSITDQTIIPFSEIPHFPLSTVKGHEGNLIVGSFEGMQVALLQGRVHLYEGYSGPDVGFPIRTMGFLGAKIAFLTNSAGGLNGELQLGDLMLITNHISLFGDDPTVGVYHPRLGELFYDVYEAFDRDLCEIARKAYAACNVPLHEGTYVLYKGCSYESRAEIAMLATLGADAVGKSTVPEVLAAKQLGMRVLGISCITTDMSPAGMAKQSGPVNHDDILEAGRKSEEKLRLLIEEILRGIHRNK